LTNIAFFRVMLRSLATDSSPVAVLLSFSPVPRVELIKTAALSPSASPHPLRAVSGERGESGLCLRRDLLLLLRRRRRLRRKPTPTGRPGPMRGNRPKGEKRREEGGEGLTLGRGGPVHYVQMKARSFSPPRLSFPDKSIITTRRIPSADVDKNDFE